MNNKKGIKLSRKKSSKLMMAGLCRPALLLILLLPGKMKMQEDNAQNDLPNIVFICSDQHSYKYTGYSGRSIVRTPNLDRIAKNGVVFSNAYAGSPVCVPSRTSLMTGMFPSDCNSFGNSTVWNGSYPTWGIRLQKAGYETWATGKMDLNSNYELGFIQQEVSNGHGHSPDITELFRTPMMYRVDERSGVEGKPRSNRHKKDTRLLHNALQYLQNKKPGTGRPWAAYIGFLEPHPPFVALEKYYNLYYPNLVDMPNIPPGHLEEMHLMFQRLRSSKMLDTPIPEERVRRAKAAYFGSITELDEYVGQLWDALEKSGQLKNTIFIYTSDHGEMLGEHGLWFKNNLYENAIHVPLIIAGGRLPKGKRIDVPVTHADLIYTLLEWTGAERPSYLRGHSLTSLISGKGLGEHPGYAYAESNSEGNLTGSYMIRKGNWKYIHFTWYDNLLFNLATDPGEFTNRIDDPSAKEIQQELKGILYSLVDPEEITKRGFQEQEEFLDSLVRELSTEELVDKLKGRLGEGQAKALVNKLKK